MMASRALQPRGATERDTTVPRKVAVIKAWLGHAKAVGQVIDAAGAKERWLLTFADQELGSPPLIQR